MSARQVYPAGPPYREWAKGQTPQCNTCGRSVKKSSSLKWIVLPNVRSINVRKRFGLPDKETKHSKRALCCPRCRKTFRS